MIPEIVSVEGKEIASLGGRVTRGDVVVPLCEEVVWLSHHVALACGAVGPSLATTDRRLQRTKLRAELSPLWAVDRLPASPGPWFVKAPASTLSQGVAKLFRAGQLRKQKQDVWRNNPLLQSLLEQGWEPGYQVVVEEFIEGLQWEVNGVVANGRVVVLGEPIRHTWRGRSIVRYEQTTEWRDELRGAVVQTVQDLGLDWCAFCIELRMAGGRPVVIDAHCRPGEEPAGEAKGYTEAVGRNFPVEMAEAFLRGERERRQ